MAKTNLLEPSDPPSKEAEELSDAVADGLHDVENTPAMAFVERHAELMSDPKGRNPKIWEAAGANIEYTVEQFANVPKRLWTSDDATALQRTIAASQQQAMVETLYDGWLEIADKSAVRREAIVAKMDRPQLKEAATAGLISDKVKQRKDGQGEKKPSA